MRHRLSIDGTWYLQTQISDMEFKENTVEQLRLLMIAKTEMLYMVAKKEFKRQKKLTQK